MLTGAVCDWVSAVDQQVALGNGGRLHRHLEKGDPRALPQLEAHLLPPAVPLGQRKGLGSSLHPAPYTLNPNP